MSQKTLAVWAIIILGLLFAGYMAFFAKKPEQTVQQVASQDTQQVQQAQVSTGVTVREAKNGMEYFATKNGMALYTFSKDTFNTSNCVDECAKNWPAFYSEELLPEDGFGVITRADGSKQSTYLERPLYTFIKDTKPGDTNGHGVNGVWYLATFSK